MVETEKDRYFTLQKISILFNSTVQNGSEFIVVYRLMPAPHVPLLMNMFVDFCYFTHSLCNCPLALSVE